MTAYQLYYLHRERSQYNPVKVNDLRYAKSTRSRECVYCGCEIPKGDYYYSFKPIFEKRKSRCISCKPKIYNDVEMFDY